MSLLDRLQTDMRAAMKARDKVRLSTVRLLISDLKNERIKLTRDLEESDELTVLSRQAKRRRESIQAFEEAGRPDAAEAEHAELKIIEGYLPDQLSAADVREMIKEVIAEVGAASRKDFGKVMRAIMPKLKGRFPGKEVKPMVEELLC